MLNQLFYQNQEQLNQKGSKIKSSGFHFEFNTNEDENNELIDKKNEIKNQKINEDNLASSRKEKQISSGPFVLTILIFILVIWFSIQFLKYMINLEQNRESDEQTFLKTQQLKKNYQNGIVKIMVSNLYQQMSQQKSQEILSLLTIAQNINIYSQKVEGNIFDSFFKDKFLTKKYESLHERSDLIKNKNDDKAPKKQEINKIIEEQRLYFEDQYQIWKYEQEELPICVLVYQNQFLKQEFEGKDRLKGDESINNQQQIQQKLYLEHYKLFKTLNSILQQQYKQFLLIFSSSSKQKITFAKLYQQKFQISSDQLIIILNKDQANINANNNLQSKKNIQLFDQLVKQYCSADYILVPLEIHSELVGRQVFNFINSKFISPNSDMTYNQVLLANSVKIVSDINNQPMFWKTKKFLFSNQKEFNTQQIFKFSNYFICYRYGSLQEIQNKIQFAQLAQLPNNKQLKNVIISNFLLNFISKTQIQISQECVVKLSSLQLKVTYHQAQILQSTFQKINQLNFLRQQIQTKDIKKLSKSELTDPVLRSTYIKSQNVFDDSIYSRPETKITETQYEQAKQRMKILNYPSKYTPEQILLISETQKKYFQDKYQEMLQFDSFDKQLAFCIIVPSYKNNHNGKIQANLNSIFIQEYENYHVIYIDDNSLDGTSERVIEYIQTNKKAKQKLKLIVNKKNVGALQNIYQTVHDNCNSGQIMIIIDGDDFLIGKQVFRFVNSQYQTKKLLALYTNYLRIHYPIYLKVGTSTAYSKQTIQKKRMRKSKIFRASHLRTFYVDLFKKIQIKDLKDENKNFFTAANDFAIMMPILQMCGDMFEYIPQLMYVYDSGTGLNNFQTKQQIQKRNFELTRKRKAYQRLSNQDLTFLTQQNYKRIERNQ